MQQSECEAIQFSVATAAGRGAVATVIIIGDRAEHCVNQLFRPASRQPISASHYNKILYGHWINDGIPGEDLVVCPKHSSHIEVHCHGGESATRIISRSLVAVGAKKINQAEMAGIIGNSQYTADFQLAIAAAPTQTTAKLILRQQTVQNSFWRHLRSLVSDKQTRQIISSIDDFLSWETFGLRLTSSWSVVLCGPPNVGKSSLINSMLGFHRAIVNPVAGTTRDVVVATTAFNGWPVQLSDTAGVRDSENRIEREGIFQARRTIKAGDLVVLVIDGDPTNAPIENLMRTLKPDLVVGNKSDLEADYQFPTDVNVSAKTGDGIDILIKKISSCLVPRAPGPTQSIPISKFQVETIRNLRRSVELADWTAADSTVAGFVVEHRHSRNQLN